MANKVGDYRREAKAALSPGRVYHPGASRAGAYDSQRPHTLFTFLLSEDKIVLSLWHCPASVPCGMKGWVLPTTLVLARKQEEFGLSSLPNEG